MGSALSPVETQFCTTPPLLGVLQVSPKLLLIRDFYLVCASSLSSPANSSWSSWLFQNQPCPHTSPPHQRCSWPWPWHHLQSCGACGSLGRGCDGPSPTVGLQQLPQTPSVPRPWAFTGFLTRPFRLSPLVLLVSRSVLCSPRLGDSGLVLCRKAPLYGDQGPPHCWTLIFLKNLNTWPGWQETSVIPMVSSSPFPYFQLKKEDLLLERLLDCFVPPLVPPRSGLALGSSRKCIDLNGAILAEMRWSDMIKPRQEGLPSCIFGTWWASGSVETNSAV